MSKAVTQITGDDFVNVFDGADTARVVDCNGWWEVPSNPVSSVGIFEYLAKDIPGTEGLGKDIVKVLRPAEELGSPETIASARLLPWVDDHLMLGEVPNGQPAEEKGIHGVVGEQIDFDGKTLFANIKMFSKALADLVASGKKALSLGYRCKYEYAPGTLNGESYDFIQRFIRFNHLASVDDGRMGPTVAVLDSADTLKPNEKETTKMTDENKQNDAGDANATGEMTLEQALSAFSKLLPFFQKLMAAQNAATEPAEAVEETKVETDPPVPAEDEDDTEKKKDEDGAASAMDAAIKRAVAPLQKQIATLTAAAKANTPAAIAATFAQRDKLAAQLTPFVGTFDHSIMSAQQVAEYGVKKLELQAPAGSETAVLQGYLQAATAPALRQLVDGNAMDSAVPAGKKKAAFLNDWEAQ